MNLESPENPLSEYPIIKLCIGICTTLGKTLDDLFWKDGDDGN